MSHIAPGRGLYRLYDSPAQLSIEVSDASLAIQVYAAESMPLYIRDIGMSMATAINWFFNWLLAFTFPYFFNSSLGNTGAFVYYAGWCVVGWFLVLLYFPALGLEPDNRWC